MSDAVPAPTLQPVARHGLVTLVPTNAILGTTVQESADHHDHHHEE